MIPMVSILQKYVQDFNPTQELGFQLKSAILVKNGLFE